MKHIKSIVIIFAGIIVILLGVLIFVQPAKGPTAPFSPSPSPAVQPIVSSDGRVAVSMPLPNAQISSPLGVQGTVTGGGWFFEASFPVKVLDGDGAVLGQVPAQALGEWMTTGTVPFAANIPFTAPRYATGTLLLEKDNPSGLPLNSGELRIPVRFR